jgi:hypothetical protein
MPQKPDRMLILQDMTPTARKPEGQAELIELERQYIAEAEEELAAKLATIDVGVAAASAKNITSMLLTLGESPDIPDPEASASLSHLHIDGLIMSFEQRRILISRALTEAQALEDEFKTRADTITAWWKITTTFEKEWEVQADMRVRMTGLSECIDHIANALSIARHLYARVSDQIISLHGISRRKFDAAADRLPGQPIGKTASIFDEV